MGFAGQECWSGLPLLSPSDSVNNPCPIIFQLFYYIQEKVSLEGEDTSNTDALVHVCSVGSKYNLRREEPDGLQSMGSQRVLCP